jgi:hypothetical protein
LDAAVELQLERLLPISPEAALSQWWVARQDAQWISVRAAIARREHVQGLYDRARAVGLHVVRIAAADSGELVGNLLPKRTGARRFHWSAFDKKLLWGAAILALATCAVTAGQWVFERARLNAELERTERLAAQARSISQRLEQESSGVRSLAHELSRADAGDILAHLTERIPSNAWIYDLEIAPAANDGVKIRFDGLVPTATQFVENLEKTHEFRDVRLVSATSAGLGTGKDRIRVTALWEKQ